MWRTDQAPNLAADYLGGLGDRLGHVQTVGRLAEWMVAELGLPPEIAAAAWLHDIGYAPGLAVTGFHPVDGATFLSNEGAPDRVVQLVAHHTGAWFEADERGLTNDLQRFDVPDPEDLDILNLIDLVSSPTGATTTPHDRVGEILHRYPEGHPVHRAVSRSRPELLASASRARTRLGLSDVWPAGVLESVGQTQPH